MFAMFGRILDALLSTVIVLAVLALLVYGITIMFG
jgi:hypothetical protein